MYRRSRIPAVVVILIQKRQWSGWRWQWREPLVHRPNTRVTTATDHPHRLPPSSPSPSPCRCSNLLLLLLLLLKLLLMLLLLLLLLLMLVSSPCEAHHEVQTWLGLRQATVDAAAASVAPVAVGDGGRLRRRRPGCLRLWRRLTRMRMRL